jgi:hypothetical protein
VLGRPHGSLNWPVFGMLFAAMAAAPAAHNAAA